MVMEMKMMMRIRKVLIPGILKGRGRKEICPYMKENKVLITVLRKKIKLI